MRTIVQGNYTSMGSKVFVERSLPSRLLGERRVWFERELERARNAVSSARSTASNDSLRWCVASHTAERPPPSVRSGRAPAERRAEASSAAGERGGVGLSSAPPCAVAAAPQLTPVDAADEEARFLGQPPNDAPDSVMGPWHAAEYDSGTGTLVFSHAHRGPHVGIWHAVAGTPGSVRLPHVRRAPAAGSPPALACQSLAAR